MKISKLHISLEDKTLVDISLEIKSSLALVGESGSGKSLSLKAILGMLPENLKLELECDFELKAGKNVFYVPQNPFTSLSPLTKIYKQLFTSQDDAISIFKKVDLDIKLLDRFPPELSGGQLQRVVIAMAIKSRAKLLLLDEITTALDVKTKNVILHLLKNLQKENGFKILLVTHDISSAKYLCEDISIIKNGKIIENGDMMSVFDNPQNRYTKNLINSNFKNMEFRV